MVRPRRYASPVGTMAAVSTIRITARSGARVRCLTLLGTTNPWCGCRSTERSSRSMTKCPSKAKKNSSSLSCLCQWYSPCTTPRRTTESFTWQSVWLYHLSAQDLTSAGTSTKRRTGNLNIEVSSVRIILLFAHGLDSKPVRGRLEHGWEVEEQK